MSEEKDIWKRIVSTLESQLPSSEFKTWFSQAILKKFDPRLALIEVPNKFVASWLKENYLEQIQKSFESHAQFLPQIRFSYGSSPAGDRLERPNGAAETHGAIAHPVNPLYTFKNFVTAGSNRFAYSSAMKVASSPLTDYNPLYLFANLSLGKTHLLHAIGNHMLTLRPALHMAYVSCNTFSQDLSSSIRSRNISKFRKTYETLDVLLLDDLDEISSRKRSQEELVSVFDHLYHSGKQLVFAAKRPPTQMDTLLSNLRSRLEWGLLSEIHVPDHRTKMKIIKERAQTENFTLRDDVAFFLAKATDDVKTLMQYLVRLETYRSLYRRKIDMSAAKSIIKTAHLGNIGVRDIQRLTAEYFNISVSELLSNKKSRRFSYPRQIAMYLSRKLTDLSLKEIGQLFANKDHSTVVYAVKRIDAERDRKQEVTSDILRLEKLLS
jgi:chromosomal replication initiator protein